MNTSSNLMLADFGFNFTELISAGIKTVSPLLNFSVPAEVLSSKLPSRTI